VGEVTTAPDPWQTVALLDSRGHYTGHPQYPVLLDDDALRGLHRDMLLTRQLDITATALQQQGELGLWASSRGQEAVSVGIASALAPGDMAFPSYREHGLAWCLGVDVAGILGLFRGVTHGGWDPAIGLACPSIVIGSQVLHAVGYAMGQQLDGDPAATVVVFGDGASSQGDVLEAMVWAASFEAPVVFVCINNGWAISVPVTRQSRVPLAQRAAGFGFASSRVDGNDVLAVHGVVGAALNRARSGGGPFLVEAVTYRMAAHTSADDDTRYRSRREVEQWQERDPISRIEAHLVECGLLTQEDLARLEAEGRALAERVRREVRTMPSPDARTLGQYTYASDAEVLTARIPTGQEHEPVPANPDRASAPVLSIP